MTNSAQIVQLAAGSSARDLAASIARRLSDAGIASPDVDARWLIEAVVGIDPWRQPEAVVTPTPALAVALARRERREPLQLIVGETAFLDLIIECRPGVFVPRPETEVLARLAIEALAGRSEPVIVEPCTGTGAIACAIARHVPGAHVVAIDCDAKAADLARVNARRTLATAAHPSQDRRGATIDVLVGDLLTPLTDDLAGRVDVVVANPPYLPSRDAATWEPEVADHDPHGALIGGDDGHEVVARLVIGAAPWLRPDGIAMIEIDARRPQQVIALAESAGWGDVRIVEDLAGQPRFVVLQGPSTTTLSVGHEPPTSRISHG